MDAKKMSREQISALVDGELIESDIESALALLRQPQEQLTWRVYHQVGEVLRSDEMAFALSEDFSSKIHARLAAEPIIIAPQFQAVEREEAVMPLVANGVRLFKPAARRFVVPCLAAVCAVVVVVFVTSPQQNVTLANSSASIFPALAMEGKITSASAGQQVVVHASGLADQEEPARYSRLDDYFWAHQQFSPSMYSSAQYVRSAAFVVESDK